MHTLHANDDTAGRDKKNTLGKAVYGSLTILLSHTSIDAFCRIAHHMECVLQNVEHDLELGKD